MALAPSTRAQAGERFTLDERQYRRVADVALFTLTLIIFTGAAVRLTGSGLGCPNWPKCNGGLFPPLHSHQLIEYGNRMVTGVVGLPALAAAIGAHRLRPFRSELVRPALILPLGVFAQALLGGITVLLDLSWEVVIVHYLLSCALLVAGAVLVWRVHRGAGAHTPVHPRPTVLAARGLAVLGGVVLVAGTFATAAGPHAGGAGTGDYVGRLSAVSVRTLIHWHGHIAAALGFLAVGFWLYARRRGRASATLMRALTAACVLLAVQGVVGLVQYHNALPSGLVWVHVSLAAVLWLALVFAALAAGRYET
jgi:cytochrome c oxidase assembly protein subunit 15